MSHDTIITSMVLNCSPSKISEFVIMPVVKFVIKKFKSQLGNLKTYGLTYRGKYDSKTISIVPTTMGAPAAAAVMEALNNTKAKYIFKVDYCGGLTQDIKLGDIIVADSAICGDGTSPHYDSNANIIEADAELLEKLTSFFDDNKIKYHKGPIYTTDAIFRETEELLNKARSMNAIGIDMETSILYLLGKIFNKKVISVNVVSDKPSPDKKFDVSLNSRVFDNTDMLVKLILDFIKDFEK
ncbi:MAG: nucleoside phosphorylase [Candidatus Helarchaeota archaeon]